ncbi:MAG: hypothetical protein D3916_14005, partial [Candidatus Electrothrix sp. MAN1_4]|nr:hypothetical protein [Candidatus Electrothrix sp. MAN1_4]
RFTDGLSSSEEDFILSLESVAEKIAPSDPLNLYQRLFDKRDFDLYEKNGNLESQRKKLAERRKQAINEILTSGGIDSVIRFSNLVESPFTVGTILADLTNIETDTILLPTYLKKSEGDVSSFFIRGYIQHRYFNKGWPWVDSLNKSDWNSRQLFEFLCFLPFTNGTWERVATWLGDAEELYWLKVNADPYQDSHIKSRTLSIAIEKLVKYGRPYAAIHCLHLMFHNKEQIDAAQCVRVLLAAVSSTEPHHLFEAYDAAELIKMLQANKEARKDDLYKVEWAYLSLLDGRHHGGVRPKLLENRLANEPDFFCEVVRFICRSKNRDIPDNKFSEQEKNIAKNAWRLLYNWRTPPGIQEDGSFDRTHFSGWLKRVKELCAESGHLDVALRRIGEKLVYCPSDPNGLWIDSTVATILNEKDADEMRNSFRIGLFNSRNDSRLLRAVDPTGKPERKLAEKYRQQAEDVENEGYHRLAATLRDLAKSYDRDAERIIAEHALEQA